MASLPQLFVMKLTGHISFANTLSWYDLDIFNNAPACQCST